MTLASPKRIGGLVLAATFVVAACGGSARHQRPGRPARPTATGAAGREPGRGAVERRDRRLRLVHRRADLDRRRRGAGRREPGLHLHDHRARAPATASRRFCAGETDISDASRKIKDEEAKACADAGIEYVELKIAYRRHVRADLGQQQGGRLPVASPTSTPSSAPSPRASASGATRAALAKELGSNTVLPDADLDDHRPRRGVRHVRQLRRARPRRRSRRRATRSTRRPGTRPPAPTTPRRANDNAIIDGIAGSDTSLGWVGFAFAEENKDKVKEIQVSQGPERDLRQPRRRDHRRRLLPALPHPVHLRQQGEGRREPRGRRLRRLLPRRRHHLDGARDRPLREPAGRDARRTRADLGRRQVAPSSSANRSGQLGARPVRLSSAA